MELLKKISLFKLQKPEMKNVKGGNECGCSCYWEGSGGSSTDDNCDANHKHNYNSAQGPPKCFNFAPTPVD